MQKPIPDWAESKVNMPDPNRPGYRIVGLRFKDDKDHLLFDQMTRFEEWAEGTINDENR